MELALIAGFLFLYFVPSLTAFARGSRDAGGVFVVNLFLGWTLLGWVVALAWAFSGPANRKAPAGETTRYEPLAAAPAGAAGEIERLLALRDSGALTEAEFAAAKEKALAR